MPNTLLDLLIIVCVGLLVWGIIRLDRIYQYPFFMGAVLVSFLLPQGFALLNEPGVADLETVSRVLLASIFCAVMCWVGYQFKPNAGWLRKADIPLHNGKLRNAGIALTAMGYFFNFLLANTVIETASNGNWTGAATIYAFFSQVIYIAFSILLLCGLKKPSSSNIILIAISAIPVLQTIINGRRQPTMTFLVIIGLSFWLVRRYTPPRWIVILATLSIAVLIPLFAQLRGEVWALVFNGQWNDIIQYSQNSFDLLLKGEILELRNAAMLMDAVEETGRYGYGRGFWDSIVFQYVPGQLVGFDFKQSLQFNSNLISDLASVSGYSVPNGSTLTGIGDSFIEFSYFGCLVFALIGYLFKNLWVSAVYQNNVFSQILYMGLVSPAMVSITHGVGRFLQEAIFQLIFVGLVVFYAKSKPLPAQIPFNLKQSIVK